MQIIPYPHNRKSSFFFRDRGEGYKPNPRPSPPPPFAVAVKICVPVTIWIQTEFKKTSDYSYEEYMNGKCLHPSLENLSRKRDLFCPLCLCYISHQCLELLPSNILARNVYALPYLSSGELLSSLLGLQTMRLAVVSHCGKAKLLN